MWGSSSTRRTASSRLGHHYCIQINQQVTVRVYRHMPWGTPKQSIWLEYEAADKLQD